MGREVLLKIFAKRIPTLICLSLVGVFQYFEINRIARAVFVSQVNYVTAVARIVFGWLIFG